MRERLRKDSYTVARLSFCFLCLVLFGCGLDETTIRSDKPVSRGVAAKDTELPFPSSARDVYYLVHSGGMQEFHMFVRFTADANQLDEALNAILEKEHKKMGESWTYSKLPLSKAPRPLDSRVLPSTELLPMPWWDPESITNGYYYGATNNGEPITFWVDESRHVIYLSETD